MLRFAQAYLDGDVPGARARSSSGGRRARGSTARSRDAALSLDGSYLFVQGPPGSGKTWHGARMAIALMRAGSASAITSLSHKAIHKFLEDVEAAAVEQGFAFHGRKKCERRTRSRYEERVRRLHDRQRSDCSTTRCSCVAGTSWLFSREELDRHVDTLFVDEAGQVALADALAVGTAARNLVLLGDPNQLPQVSQGSHPPGAGASVLAAPARRATRRCGPAWGSSSSRPGACGPR